MNLTPSLPALILAAACACLPLHAEVILDDRFVDGDRSTQNLPASSRWFFHSGAGSLTASPGAMNWTIAGGYGSMLTYFSASGSPVQLAVGDTLAVSFTMNVANPGATPLDQSLRFGLFNSQGTRVSADGGTRFNNIFNNYQGYYGSINPLSSAANKFYAYRRGGTAANDLFTQSSIFLPSSGAGLQWSAGVINGSLSVTRLASGLRFRAQLGDAVVDVTDATSTYFSFDTLAFYTAGETNTAASLTFTHFEVERLQAVPEPGVAALLLGVGVLFCRRRWKQRG